MSGTATSKTVKKAGLSRFVDEAGVVGDQDAIVFVVEGDVGGVDPRDIGRGGVAAMLLAVGEEDADFAQAGEGDVELTVLGEGDAIGASEAGGGGGVTLIGSAGRRWVGRPGRLKWRRGRDHCER